MNILLPLFLVNGILLILISLPLIDGKIKPNPFYGFRVRQTLENPEIWYAVNRHAGRRLLISGVVTLAAAVLFFLIPDISLDLYATACAVVSVLSIMIGLGQTIRYLRSMTE